MLNQFRTKSGIYSGSSDGYGEGCPIGGGISNGIDSGGPGKQYPEQLTAKYIVGRLLGTGSCGSVYLGKDNWHNSSVGDIDFSYKNEGGVC